MGVLLVPRLCDTPLPITHAQRYVSLRTMNDERACPSNEMGHQKKSMYLVLGEESVTEIGRRQRRGWECGFSVCVGERWLPTEVEQKRGVSGSDELVCERAHAQTFAQTDKQNKRKENKTTRSDNERGTKGRNNPYKSERPRSC